MSNTDDERVSLFDDATPSGADAGAADTEAAAAAAAAPRRGKKRLRDRWLLLTVFVVLGAILVGVAVVVGWYGKATLDGLNQVKRDPELTVVDYEGRPTPAPTKPGAKYAPMNIVLMGSDRRSTAERGRSDVLMVLHISGDRKNAYLISLPRDYWVPIPGHGTAKINAAYSWGGPQLTVQTVEQLLNIRVDHTALIDFDGFTKVIDAVGGIQVYNRHASKIDGQVFPEGFVQLDGAKALMFVRNRYDLPNGDFDRNERQRDVIKAVLDKLASRGVLTDPVKFRDSVTTLGPNFTVDTAFTNQKIIELGTQMRITTGNDVRSMMAPYSHFGTSSDGQWYAAVDQPKLAAIAAAMRGDTMDQYWASR
ncbi:LCP family protein [Propionibacteriaceae bacterium G57]|uniref:LCP family protein n=1 Tax=Aestuariimicrobium sp. G57 TaxID=3418485 RepID=UPI003DA71C13